jgi:hypothetical protein
LILLQKNFILIRDTPRRGTHDMTNPEEISHVNRRQCGGWIGIFDDGSLRFGVTGQTEEEVAVALRHSLERWRTAAALSPAGEISRVREV